MTTELMAGRWAIALDRHWAAGQPGGRDMHVGPRRAALHSHGTLYCVGGVRLPAAVRGVPVEASLLTSLYQYGEGGCFHMVVRALR